MEGEEDTAKYSIRQLVSRQSRYQDGPLLPWGDQSPYHPTPPLPHQWSSHTIRAPSPQPAVLLQSDTSVIKPHHKSPISSASCSPSAGHIMDLLSSPLCRNLLVGSEQWKKKKRSCSHKPKYGRGWGAQQIRYDSHECMEESRNSEQNAQCCVLIRTQHWTHNYVVVSSFPSSQLLEYLFNFLFSLPSRFTVFSHTSCHPFLWPS